jgi:hypothetical protein
MFDSPGVEMLGPSGLARWLIVSTVENFWLNAPEAKEAGAESRCLLLLPPLRGVTEARL